MNLLELQRRMEEDVRRPLTADFAMQRMAEDGQSTEEIAASYISPNVRLSSFERLEIYNRQYWFRLISVVSEDFPTLNAVIGTKLFDALILAYLHRIPRPPGPCGTWEPACRSSWKHIPSSVADAIVLLLTSQD
jgi:Putative DNA-binding domain